MTGPRFSVLMPTHYRADVIGYAIRSVLAQTEPDFELLVVGDGAEPGTAEAVQAFHDPRIRWFDLPKSPGFGYANRNLALAESRGELLAFAADDDLMLPDHLERHAAALRNPGKEWSYSQAFWVSSDGVAAPDLTNLELADEQRYFTEVANTLCAGSFVYRASVLPDRRQWPEDNPSAGDWKIMRQLVARGTGAMARLPVPTLMHFTARRKTARHSDHSMLMGWLWFADRSPWWPATLRPNFPAGLPLQQGYLELIEGDPGFAERMRGDAADAIRRLVLEMLDGRARGLRVRPS